MRMHTVVFFFCMLSALAVERSARAKSFIFNKVSGGSSLDGKKSGDLVKNAPSVSYKRSADDLGLHPIYRRSQRKRSPYGLVYNQGKPIGILEPISQAFEYSAYASPREGGGYHGGAYKSQWVPVKREADMDEERDESEASAPLHSNNYASVLAKFKVNNKVKQRPYQDFLYSQQVKREASREQPQANKLDDVRKRGAFDIGDLSAAPQVEVKGGPNKVAEIEENLKDVMGDMGLVEKKREIYFEDEDLENGLNKIGLTKESHYDRNKKENCPGKTKTKFKAAAGKRAHKKLKKKPEEEPEEEDEDDAKRSVGQKHVERKSVGGVDVKAHVANYQSEGEAFIRSKRQQEKDSEDTDIMKGLEQSGDLTVSGNKSPLVAVTSADDLEAKKNQEKRDKEELEYEKRLERNIQAKINAIKDEVKREIGKMKSDDAQRKKREIASTLLDEETSDLDPGLNIDQKLEPYVRKRRDLLEQAEAKEETKKNSAKKKESRDAINEVKSKRGAQAEEGLVKNVTKRSEEEEEVKKNKRSETEVDLSTGRTVIDLGESNEKNGAVDEQEDKEGERQERNAKCHKEKDKKRSNVTDEGDDIAKRNLDAAVADDDAISDDYLAQRSADPQKVESDYDAQKGKIYDYGRLERNSKGGGGAGDDDSNVYRQGRKRRDVIHKKQKRYVRRKRNDFSDEDAADHLMGYRGDGDGEIDDEGDEMDDDGFNDQTSNFLLDKRQVADYDEENDGDYEDEIAEDYVERNKRNTVVDDGDQSDSDNFPFYPARRKRQDFEQLVAAHGGDAALNHLGAAHERNMRPIEKNYRRKRLEQLNKLHSQKQSIAELSESDLFGGLPQSYEGELSRFKRVKRQTLDD